MRNPQSVDPISIHETQSGNVTLKFITLEDVMKKARKKKSFRKVEWEYQWDSAYKTSNIIMKLRFEAKLSQEKLAKKTGLKQEVISRAERHGCSLILLEKVAKAVGKKLVISIADADKLK